MRSIIDRDIARLEERIRALKSRRNQLSPISSRLPAEILCNIFSFSIHSSGRGIPKSWTNFSQVSQHWRSLSLSAPGLWTDIPLGYSRWAQEMLMRSKMAKLTLRTFPSDISKPNIQVVDTIRSCLYKMNRVEEIDIDIFPELDLEEIFQGLPKSAPQLHTLRIECCDPSAQAPFRFSRPAFSIHEDFLYDTERLQRVELLNCKISWDSRILTGLTRLTLTLEDNSKARSSINQFFHALQRMPALSDLHLKNSIPDDSEVPSTYPVVDLPCLRVLSISSGVDVLTAVLRHISFPHSAILDLTCRENQSTQIDFSNFLSFFTTKFLSSLVIPSLSLEAIPFRRNYSDALKFCLWTTAIIHDDFPTSQPQLTLALTWPSGLPQSYSIYNETLICAFDAMSLPFLTQLQISTNDYIDSKTWVKTFGKLPLLEWVSVRILEACSFLEALVYKTKAAKESEAVYRNFTFPKLRYIHLADTDFGVSVPDFISINMLLDYLMERYERNAEVQVLRLEKCYSISSEDVERFKEIVVDVIWDGVER